MAVFVAIATALTLVVLGGALWPLWRNSRTLMVGLVLLLCLAASALYRIVGTPAGVFAQPAPAAAMPQTLDEAIAALREELKRNPNEPEGWQLLGRSLATQGDFAGSREAFAKALSLQPDNADLMVDVAQSRSLADPRRRFDDDALALLRRALQAQPLHQRATWFLGIAQRQRGQPAEAAKTWEPLLARVDAGTAASLRQQVDAARAEAGMPPLPEQSTPAAGNTLTVKVALDPEFAARVRLRGDASVFVIARMPGGPPMPVAVEKHALSELPLTVTLDDADSPMPTQKLSALKEVELIARLSASGNAMREEGDIESAPVRVELPAGKPVELILGKPL